MINYLKYLIFSIYIDDFIILNSYLSSTNKILNDPISKQTINKSDLFFNNWKKSQYAPALHAAHVCHSCTHTILTQRNELISIAHTHTRTRGTSIHILLCANNHYNCQGRQLWKIGENWLFSNWQHSKNAGCTQFGWQNSVVFCRLFCVQYRVA